jgi:hypothetical protein
MIKEGTNFVVGNPEIVANIIGESERHIKAYAQFKIKMIISLVLINGLTPKDHNKN